MTTKGNLSRDQTDFLDFQFDLKDEDGEVLDWYSDSIVAWAYYPLGIAQTTGGRMKHWILTRATMQTIVENLDLGRMTLGAARNYFSAYGIEIPGNTKKAFIKNLATAVMGDVKEAQA